MVNSNRVNHRLWRRDAKKLRCPVDGLEVAVSTKMMNHEDLKDLEDKIERGSSLRSWMSLRFSI